MNDTSTRSRLEREARRLFAANGYQGASVRAITQAADANLGAVTYHFGSKRALYEAVLEAQFRELAERVEAAGMPPGPTDQRLGAVVHALFAFFGENPDAPRLILRQLAAGDGLPAVALPYLRRNLAVIRRVLEEGTAAGDHRPVDPTLIAFTLVSQSVWFAIIGRDLPAIFGPAVGPGAFAERVERHVADVIRRVIAQES